MEIKDFFTQPEPSFNYVLTFEADTSIDYSKIKHLGRRWLSSGTSIVKFYSEKNKEKLALSIAEQLEIKTEAFSLVYTGDYSAVRF